jgi:hypothetical protein
VIVLYYFDTACTVAGRSIRSVLYDVFKYFTVREMGGVCEKVAGSAWDS